MKTNDISLQQSKQIPLMVDNFTAVKVKEDCYKDKYLRCESVYRNNSGKLLLSDGVVNNQIVSPDYLEDKFDYFIWSE